ncbi:MAG: DUF368 domain-containing protein [Desulfobacterales bacterium]
MLFCSRTGVPQEFRASGDERAVYGGCGYGTGVSGGTIALITGIYEDLLAAIKSANAKMAAALLRFDFKRALCELHVRFLISLFWASGWPFSALARLMNYLLAHHAELTWSMFSG